MAASHLVRQPLTPRTLLRQLVVGAATPKARPTPLPASTPACQTALAQTILSWVQDRLLPRGYARPTCTRIAFLVTGLVAGERATRGSLVQTLHGLAITPAKPESISRRLLRILDDARIDPATLLPAMGADLLPVLLESVLAAHAANAAAGDGHHRRFRPLRVVVDAMSKADTIHVLAAGLAYQGIVLPLALRTWEQNAPLEAGDYWLHLTDLLQDVQRVLPAALRDHVLLLADRFFGVPRMVDLLHVLGWAWVLRVQGQTQVQFPDGTIAALRDLTPRPGTEWCAGYALPDEAAAAAAETTPVRVFKGAGWRQCQVVAVWAVGAAEPWLLLTNLPATRARLAEYAERWAIERLFLCWKSQGWDLEASGVTAPDRVGRLVAALAIATHWRLAMAVAAASQQLADLAQRAAARAVRPIQLALPLFVPTLPPAPAVPPVARPWAAKFSLFSWGLAIVQATASQYETPALTWAFPDWEAPIWSKHAHAVYAGAA